MLYNVVAIDIVKYVAAICVIAIHTFTNAPMESMGIYILVNGIARLAVPFFFCSAGYFLSEKGFENKTVIISYIKKLIKTYIIWSLVYIPIEFIQMIGTGNLDWQHILRYLHKVVVEGTYIHLWYFPAVIFAVGLLHLMIKKIDIRIIGVIAMVVYSIGMLGDSYLGSISYFPQWIQSAMNIYIDIFITTRNGLFFGFPFVFIGLVIYKNKEKLIKINFNLLLFLSIVFVCLETYLLTYLKWPSDYNMTIFIVPAIFFLFCILLKFPSSGKVNGEKFRSYSIMIYECHLIFYGILLAIMTIFKVEILKSGIIQFLIVFAVSQLFSTVYLYVNRKKSYYIEKE